MLTLEPLLGKTIVGIGLDATNEYIKFNTEQESFAFNALGDCCSESWINHISGIETLIGNKVNKVDEIYIPDIERGENGHSERQEVDKIYSYKIFTDKGMCEIEMRNSSNGYYGGALSQSMELDVPVRIITENF